MNILSKDNINNIAEAYRKFEDITGFSRVVDVKEIEDNDFNLNVSLYVMPIEEGEKIDIFKEYSELKKLEEEKHKISQELDEILTQLSDVLVKE